MSNLKEDYSTGFLPPMTVIPKSCKTCNKPLLRGRGDKKFCNDRCRIIYNNSLKANANNLIRNVNNALRKNRRILESLIPENEQTIKVSKDSLQLHGFQFKYHTHSHTNPKGNKYIFCYEFGYLPLEGGQYLIVKQKNNSI